METAANWLEITLNLPREALDSVCARLTANGVNGLEIEDEVDFRTFLEENKQYWDYVDDELLQRMAGVCRVKLYVTNDQNGQRELRSLLAGLEHYEYQQRSLAEEDWAVGWQKYYHPMEIGRKIYIVPQWLRDEIIPDGRKAVYLNPGLTFGTGNHASTQLCLEGLEGVVKSGDRILDLGCGSGILAITSLILGAKKALGIDIDPKAVDVAYENAALNGIGRDQLTVLEGNVLENPALVHTVDTNSYNIVLANIVADVIIPLSVQVKQYLTPDGWFLCSGIIEERGDEVQSALEANGFTIISRRERNGWVSLTASISDF